MQINLYFLIWSQYNHVIYVDYYYHNNVTSADNCYPIGWLASLLNYLAFQSFDLELYLMKVIPEIIYPRLYYHHWFDTSAGGLLVPEGVILIVFFLSWIALFKT
jgi:hypothetical protein